ncbi:MAG: type transport system permease protein [Acidobacteriota bacterium]|nr:type transport system permease protein [Acidobacteriota bacterium]
MNARVFGALLLRDVTVARRELFSFLLRTGLQPLLFVTVFGFLMPRMNLIPRNYSTLVIPGVVALSVSMAAIQSVALPIVADFGFTKEIEDRLLAPISTTLVAVEKIVAGMIQAVVAAAFVLPMARLIMGPISGLTFAHAGLLVLILLLGGAACSALGLWLGTSLQPQQIGMMMSVVFVPMVMFGCAYYPWRGLSVAPVLQYAVLINPLVYISEGLRAAMTPNVPHMPIAAILGALVLLTALFTALGLRSFWKRAIG